MLRRSRNRSSESISRRAGRSDKLKSDLFAPCRIASKASLICIPSASPRPKTDPPGLPIQSEVLPKHRRREEHEAPPKPLATSPNPNNTLSQCGCGKGRNALRAPQTHSRVGTAPIAWPERCERRILMRCIQRPTYRARNIKFSTKSVVCGPSLQSASIAAMRLSANGRFCRFVTVTWSKWNLHCCVSACTV